MKNVILTIIAVLGIGGTVQAQYTYGMRETAALTAIVPEELEIPYNARQVLKAKLDQLVMQSGFIAGAGHFALVPNVVLVDKKLSRSVPEKYIIKLDVTLCVVDITDNTVITEKTFRLAGLDRLQSRATVQAINRLNPHSITIRAFMNQTKSKLKDYYADKLPVIPKVDTRVDE